MDERDDELTESVVAAATKDEKIALFKVVVSPITAAATLACAVCMIAVITALAKPWLVVSIVHSVQLVQLNDELKRKDQRIAELELQLRELTNQDAVTMTNTTPLTCPHCSRGQSSEATTSPMTTRTLSSSSDHLVFARNLSPIEEVTDGDSQMGAIRRVGNHGNKTRKDTLDQEQQKVGGHSVRTAF